MISRLHEKGSEDCVVQLDKISAFQYILQAHHGPACRNRHPNDQRPTGNRRHPAGSRPAEELSLWGQSLRVVQGSNAEIAELLLDGLLATRINYHWCHPWLRSSLPHTPE